MATSGTTSFDLSIEEIIAEAFERCGLSVRSGYDLKTSRRSLNLLFAEWANRGLNLWTIEQRTKTLTAGTTSYDLDTDLVDILSAVVLSIYIYLKKQHSLFQLNIIWKDLLLQNYICILHLMQLTHSNIMH